MLKAVDQLTINREISVHHCLEPSIGMAWSLNPVPMALARPDSVQSGAATAGAWSGLWTTKEMHWH